MTTDEFTMWVCRLILGVLVGAAFIVWLLSETGPLR